LSLSGFEVRLPRRMRFALRYAAVPENRVYSKTIPVYRVQELQKVERLCGESKKEVKYLRISKLVEEFCFLKR
jgi:hypothetical protein